MRRDAFFCIAMLTILACQAWAEDPAYVADAKLESLVEANRCWSVV